MNKLIILSTFFLMSCANTQYKRHNMAVVKYTVREYYFPAKSVETNKLIGKPIKNKRPVKRAKKVDCRQVLKDINYCAR